jgi:hypothetical protein
MQRHCTCTHVPVLAHRPVTMPHSSLHINSNWGLHVSHLALSLWPTSHHCFPIPRRPLLARTHTCQESWTAVSRQRPTVLGRRPPSLSLCTRTPFGSSSPSPAPASLVTCVVVHLTVSCYHDKSTLPDEKGHHPTSSPFHTTSPAAATRSHSPPVLPISHWPPWRCHAQSF